MKKLSFLIVTQEEDSFVRFLQEVKRLQCSCNKICWCSGFKEESISTFVCGKKWRCQKWTTHIVRQADLILLLPGIEEVSEIERQAQILKIPYLDLRGKSAKLPLLVEDCQTEKISRKWTQGFLPDPETIFCVYSCYNLKKGGFIESLKIQFVCNRPQAESWDAQKKERVKQQISSLFDLTAMNLTVDYLYQPQASYSSLQVQVSLHQPMLRDQLIRLIQQGDHVLLLQQEKEEEYSEILSLKETRVLVRVPLLAKYSKLWDIQLISDKQYCGGYSAGVLLIMDLMKKNKI